MIARGPLLFRNINFDPDSYDVKRGIGNEGRLRFHTLAVTSTIANAITPLDQPVTLSPGGVRFSWDFLTWLV